MRCCKKKIPGAIENAQGKKDSSGGKKNTLRRAHETVEIILRKFPGISGRKKKPMHGCQKTQEKHRRRERLVEETRLILARGDLKGKLYKKDRSEKIKT